MIIQHWTIISSLFYLCYLYLRGKTTTSGLLGWLYDLVRQYHLKVNFFKKIKMMVLASPNGSMASRHVFFVNNH